MSMYICKWCGSEFYSTSTQDSCESKDCKEKAHKEMITKLGYKTSLRMIPDKYTDWGNWECNYGIKGVVDFFFKEGGWAIDTQPPFQRGLVWNTEQKIAWVEHILRGGKTANVFYCNAPSWHGRKKDGEWNNNLQLIDGQQRLNALKEFVEGGFRVFGEFYYEDIFLRHDIQLKINVNDLQTDREVLKLYLEMNSGGTQHTKEEMDKVRRMIKLLEEEY